MHGCPKRFCPRFHWDPLQVAGKSACRQQEDLRQYVVEHDEVPWHLPPGNGSSSSNQNLPSKKTKGKSTAPVLDARQGLAAWSSTAVQQQQQQQQVQVPPPIGNEGGVRFPALQLVGGVDISFIPPATPTASPAAGPAQQPGQSNLSC
jgi:hypothetical protein